LSDRVTDPPAAVSQMTIYTKLFAPSQSAGALGEERLPRTRPGPASALWYLAVIPSFWSFGYTPMRGSDLWWHLATGRWIVEHRSLPMIDPWSFTRNGQPWLQHEWLSDLLFQTWVALFGLNSLVYWKWLILILTFTLLFHVLRRITGDPASSYASVLLAIATAAPFLDIRPYLYSSLGYVLIMHLVLRRGKPPLYLPLIFLVWANLHGGFFFGLMALLLLFLPSAIYGQPEHRRRVGLIWVACVLVCLLNPNGIEAFAYPLKYAFDSNSPFKQAIDEWMSPFSPGPTQAPLYPLCIAVFLAASVFLLLIPAQRKQKINWSLIALGFLTLTMSLTSRRFIVLFAIAQSLVTGKAFAVLIAARIQRLPSLIAPALVMLLGIVWLRPYPVRAYAFHYLTAEDEFPIETCNFIEINHLSGNVFAYYNWGGYLHLRTNGRMKVYIDGRADTVYDAETLVKYAHVQGFRPGWENIIEGSGADYILWPRNRAGKPLAQLIASGRWRILYDDFVSVLLVHSQESLGPLEPTPDSAYRRLTLGIKNLEERRYDLAEEYLRGALDMMPYLRTACYSLVQVQVLQGKMQEAQQGLEKCQQQFPDAARASRIKGLGK
jgi:hypothetical protein